MPAPRFFAFAYRLAAYDGMLTRRVEAQRERNHAPAGSGPKPEPSARARTGHAARAAVRPKHLANAEVVPVGAMAMAFPGLIERSRASADPGDGAAPPAEAPPPTES